MQTLFTINEGVQLSMDCTLCIYVCPTKHSLLSDQQYEARTRLAKDKNQETDEHLSDNDSTASIDINSEDYEMNVLLDHKLSS